MKKTVILIHKIKVAGLSKQQVNKILCEYSKRIQKPPMDDIEIINYLLPVNNGDNDIITLYPEKIDDEEYKERVNKAIKDLEEISEPFQPVTVKRKRKFKKIKDKLGL